MRIEATKVSVSNDLEKAQQALIVGDFGRNVHPSYAWERPACRISLR